MPKLKKALGLLDIFCIASGAMISSGLFVLPGLVFRLAGPAIILSYIIAGLLYIPAMFSKAELATAMPRAGGDYFFIDRSLGSATGTIAGLTSWFALSLKSSFALLGIGAMALLLKDSLSLLHIKLIAVSFCILFFIINIVGVKVVGRFQIVLVIALIGILIYFIYRGAHHVDPHYFRPFAPGGIKSIMKAAGMVFISYAGLTKVCSVSEEIKNPKKNLPLGMFLAFTFVTTIYVLVIFVTVGVTPASELSGSLTPITLAASKFMGTTGSNIVLIAAALAFMTTANAGIMAASRYPIAMSRDGHLPELFQETNSRFMTPHTSLIFTVSFMISAILFLDIEVLVKTASAIKLVIFILVTLAVLIMRESKIMNYRPSFKSPLYPYIHIFGIVVYAYLLILMGTKPLMIGGLFILAGMVWYWIYSRIQITRQSALTQMLQNLTMADADRPLGKTSLGIELKEIIRERDQIVEDRFDILVKNCIILDFPEKMEIKDFFRYVSQKMAKNLDVNEKTLYHQLMERESESTTVLRKGLAIPHVIIRGEEKFDILIARCKKGINYSPVLPPVNTVFVLVGTKDERAFYIRALAAIAEITTDEHFEEQWMSARTEHQMRDIVLMAERKRIHLIHCRYTPDLTEELPGEDSHKKVIDGLGELENLE